MTSAINLPTKFDQEFLQMTPADRAVIQQVGRLYAYKILAPAGLIRAEYLEPDEYLNLAAIQDMYGRNIPNLVLRGATVLALAELVSVGLADESSITNIERWFDDLLKLELK